MNTEGNPKTTPQEKQTVARVITPAEHDEHPHTPPSSSPNRSHESSRESTPEKIRDAIKSIGKHKFNPPTSQQTNNEAALGLMMFSPQTETPLPTLRTENWTFKAKTPGPISVNKARRNLAMAYATIPCELPGAGIHGYAWMVEAEEDWKSRDGITKCVKAPTKPDEPDEDDVDMMKLFMHHRKMRVYKLYAHLVQEGKDKLIEWFGKAMFADLHVRGMLPISTTPADMLSHLSKTYCKSSENRHAMREVTKAFQAPYDHKQPVEDYFFRLQEAQADAKLLGTTYTNEQMKNQALEQFERYLGKDIFKAKEKWDEEEDMSWTNFKTFWKAQIHKWERTTKTARSAHQAVTAQVLQEMDDLTSRFEALAAENRSYQEQNRALMERQVQFQHALRAEQDRRSQSDDNSTVSGITDYMNAA